MFVLKFPPSKSLAYLKLHIKTPAHPEGSLDLQDRFPVSIEDGEPRVNEGAVLLDVANGGARGGLHLHLLQAAEAAPACTPQGTHQVDHLHE